MLIWPADAVLASQSGPDQGRKWIWSVKWNWSVLPTWPVYADLASKSGPGQPKWPKVMLTLPAKVDLDSQSGQVGGLDRDPKGVWTAKVAQSMVFLEREAK